MLKISLQSTFSTLRCAVLLVVMVGFSPMAHAQERVSPDWKYVEKRLKNEGFRASFIRALKETYEPDDFRDVTELNLLLFLRKTDHHAVQVTDEATERVRDFMKENRRTLADAESRFKVMAPVIASLMWIESRYGQNPGRFHIASVFVSLLQVDRPEVIRDLKEFGVSRFSDNPSKKDLGKIAGRAKKKVKWALGELKAIEKIYRKQGDEFLDFRGSFAGAFGIPQFIPSSYARWAKAATSRTPDLNRADDAIFSVANYLNKNGWRTNRKKTHVRALMNYNNSLDYANAILRIAKRASGSHGIASVDDRPED